VARKVAYKKRKDKKKAKYTHFSFYEVPQTYTQFLGNHPNEKFYYVHLGKPTHLDGKDYR
jgi:hypothetical protein